MPDGDHQDEPNITERTRLLPADSQFAHSGNKSAEDRKYTGSWLRLLAILLLQFFPVFAYYHIVPPKLQLLEQSLCRRYYEILDPSYIQPTKTWPYYHIEESACKASVIQSNLSTVRSWGVMFDGLCVFVVSMPYGLVADRFGRVFVYVLGLVGLTLSNVWYVLVIDSPSVNTVYLSTAFLIIGGGLNVSQTMAITMGIASTTEEFKSTMLYWIMAASYLGGIVSSASAQLSMRITWLPYVVALIALCIAIVIALTLSYTTPASNEQEIQDERSERQSNDSDNGRSCCSVCSPTEAIRFIRQNPLLACVLALFPLQATRNTFIELIMPYAAKRYGWELRKAGMLDAINGTLALVLGVAALPALVKILNRHVSVPAQADCIVAICSATVIVIGSLVVAVAPTMAVMLAGWVTWSLGFGIRMSLLSIATSLVTPDHIGRTNTAILSIETISDIIISPLIWRAWSTGLNLDDSSALGLPWFVLATVYLFMVIFLTTLYRVLTGKARDTVSEVSNSTE